MEKYLLSFLNSNSVCRSERLYSGDEQKIESDHSNPLNTNLIIFPWNMRISFTATTKILNLYVKYQKYFSVCKTIHEAARSSTALRFLWFVIFSLLGTFIVRLFIAPSQIIKNIEKFSITEIACSCQFEYFWLSFLSAFAFECIKYFSANSFTLFISHMKIELRMRTRRK